MSDLSFRYVALDPVRGRVRGDIVADSEAVAFERIRALGLSPLSLSAKRAEAADQSRDQRLTARQAASLIGDLGALLVAGADIRSALRILGSRKGAGGRAVIARQLAADVSGGEALDTALLHRLGPRYEFVAALTAAGEASGDPGAGLLRAAQVLERQLAVRDQLASALSYPLFVAATAVASFLVILLLVVPSLAPLAAEGGDTSTTALSILLSLSTFLIDNGLPILIVIATGIGLFVAAGAAGLLKAPLERAMLDGPARGIVRGLIYGGFATDLGGVLSSGAPMGEALRLAARSVSLDLARQRLAPLPVAIREGETLSTALASIANLPEGVTSLALIGEEIGALGPMLEKAGRMEEAAALKRIEVLGRLIGPVMIVALGGLIGLMMASLLSSVSSLGGSALG